MTPNALAKQIFATYEEFALLHLGPSVCKHGVVTDEIQRLVARSDGLLSREELGASLEGRSISLIRAGRGPRRVLLWSQMHGDEPTATLALCDFFNFLVESARERPWGRAVLEGITIAAIPMLNPDGAEAVRRENATHVDLNRDAKALATPEGRILRETHRALKPAFGFNLHDQDLHSVGTTRKVAALAFLAPPPDERRSRPVPRLRAMRVCALMARALQQFVEGHIATYDDSYEARAFGDRMQSWGTGTVLIESGHWPQDPEKKFVRKLNVVALLVALHAIATGAYQDVELEHYHSLKENGSLLYDLIVRGVKVVHPSGWSARLDLGVSLEPEANRRSAAPLAMIKEIGDLHTCGALQTLDGSARSISAAEIAVERQLPLTGLLDLLQLYSP
jgi:Zinc carboxypeptidase